MQLLEFRGAAAIRQRIILSLLTGKSIRIKDIRSSNDNPGLLDSEILLLRLVESITNGSTIDINYTGTEFTLKPGNIAGGSIEFDCGTDRGITSDDIDQTIDGVKNANVRILQLFGISDGFDFKILKRGASPLGGGKVFFTCPVIAHLTPINLVDIGRIKKIRGVASTTRVSPQISNRMIEAVRSKFNEFIPDVFIFSDVAKGQEAGLSAGYSLYLQAESTTGATLCADGVGKSDVPVEDMTLKICKNLLHEIRNGGMFDQAHQWMVLLLMALCPQELCKISFGPLSSQIEQYLLPDIKQFLGLNFQIKKNQNTENGIVVSCIGSGFVNINKRTQ